MKIVRKHGLGGSNEQNESKYLSDEYRVAPSKNTKIKVHCAHCRAIVGTVHTQT